jgi:hypothetical protein
MSGAVHPRSHIIIFIMRSSDPYKARSPLDIELVNV